MAMLWYLGTARSRPSLTPKHHLSRFLYGQAQGTTNIDGGTLQRQVAFYGVSAYPEISGLKG